MGGRKLEILDMTSQKIYFRMTINSIRCGFVCRNF